MYSNFYSSLSIRSIHVLHILHGVDNETLNLSARSGSKWPIYTINRHTETGTLNIIYFIIFILLLIFTICRPFTSKATDCGRKTAVDCSETVWRTAGTQMQPTGLTWYQFNTILAPQHAASQIPLWLNVILNALSKQTAWPFMSLL